jgi:hypothetical protein
MSVPAEPLRGNERANVVIVAAKRGAHGAPAQGAEDEIW